jgi:archaellum biogenesis ATPase FlaH
LDYIYVSGGLMERELLSASLSSRENYELVKQHIDLKLSTYSKLFQIVLAKVGEYYSRDEATQSVASDVLLAQMESTIRNQKHIDSIKGMLSDAAGSDTSVENVKAVVLLAKQQEAQDKLAQALASGIPPKGTTIDEMIEEVKKLRALNNLDELTKEEIEVYNNVDLASLLRKEFDPSTRIKLFPKSLNDRLEGGVKRGHHIIIFARPETGKSMTVINMSCGFLRQGLRVLYVINEDRPEDIIIRHVANLSSMTKKEQDANTDKAVQLSESVGFHNLYVANASPGTPEQIDKLVEQFQPDVLIVDQLRNLKVKADNRVLQLEEAATAMRTLGKKRNILVISVTQAGDSADGKAILEMGDVDFSNTGIPAQADLMIGIGMDDVLEAENRRMFNLPKNKISGEHEHFPVDIVPWLSRVTSIK